MSTDGRIAVPAPTAADLESAGFVRIVARPDGDALAAGGILARALATVETPFQVGVARTVADRTDRLDDRDERAPSDVALAIGAVDGDHLRLEPGERPVTLAACELARQLDAPPDPTLALAGVVATGLRPDADEVEEAVTDALGGDLDALDGDAVERRAGVAIPTADPVDGLAHSTRVRAPWSGDRDAVREALADVTTNAATDDASEDDPAPTDDDRRAIASLVAIDAVAATAASAAAADSLTGVLRPYATPAGPFETVGGYADVLEAAAHVEPGTGVALAMGHRAREAALAAWREHGRQAHAALDGASTGRYDGLFVVGVDDGPVESVARLAADYRSPEPATLALGDGEAALALRGGGAAETATAIEAAAGELTDRVGDCGYDVARRRGYFRYDRDADDAAIIAATRDAL